MIQAKVVADSKNEFGNRITTMEVVMPRFILAEFNTHRMFSRNSASSRAIPFEKMLKMVEETPFIPIAWQKDHKGMQGTEYFPQGELLPSKWLEARDSALEVAKSLALISGVTKQLCNRLLEPFMYHKVLITATEWENFFALRCPKYGLFYEQIPMEFRSKKALINFTKKVEADEFKNSYDNLTELDWLKLNKGQAEIHMMELAEQMWDAMNESTPKELKAGEWHIPYEDKINYSIFNQIMDMEVIEGKTPQEVAVMISTVMCARVSYTTIETEQSEWTYTKYINKHQELTTANPLHASPMEHCARTMNAKEQYDNNYSGNFRGFIQYRKTFQNENIEK